MPIKSEKWERLRKRMAFLNIKEEDLVEKFILGSGKGGQHLQKTSSCVYLKHLPSGIEVKCMKERFRELNRYFAREELCNQIEEKIFKKETEKKKEQYKIKKQKQRRSRRQKQKMLEAKKFHSAKKELRQIPPIDN